MAKEHQEGLYGEAQNTKAQNLRFIITTALVAILILGIAAWGIIYAVGGGNKNTTNNPAEETTEVAEAESAETSTEATAEKTDNVVEVTDLKETEATETAAETVETAAAENIPKTGPSDILPVAVLLGSAVTFLGSVKLAKSEA